MKYKIELIIIIIIISIITILEVYTNRNTKRVLDEFLISLDYLKNEIKQNNYNLEKVDKIINAWDKEYKKLSLYIEHDELEKVGNVFFRLKENIDSQNNSNVLENIEEIKFLLNHINKKGILNLQNVF